MIVFLLGVASAEAPAPPPPPYLDRGSVQVALATAPDRVAACVPADAAPGLVRASVLLHGGGRVELVSLDGTPGDAGCWSEALGGMPGPRHAGAPVDAAFGLPFAGGAVGTALDLRLHTPTPDPLFLHVPGTLSETELRALREALGLEAPAP
jgi:hypothetical protein